MHLFALLRRWSPCTQLQVGTIIMVMAMKTQNYKGVPFPVFPHTPDIVIEQAWFELIANKEYRTLSLFICIMHCLISTCRLFKKPKQKIRITFSIVKPWWIHNKRRLLAFCVEVINCVQEWQIGQPHGRSSSVLRNQHRSGYQVGCRSGRFQTWGP